MTFTMRIRAFSFAAVVMTLAAVPTHPLSAQQPSPRPSVFQTTLEEPNQKTSEITTEQLQAILTAGIVPVFDVRTPKEYAIAHIPGTVNIYEKEVQQIINQYPDRSARMILYCNGPSCGKSKRTSEELVAAGYTQVQRYQLGLPVWRALSQTVQTDLPGLKYIWSGDHTAVFVDARTPSEFAGGTMPGATSIRKGEATAANDDGRLPFEDKGTRIVVFGNTAQQAAVVAAEIAKKAYWNSSYFGGTFDDLMLAGLINHRPVVVARNITVAAGSACTASVSASNIDNGSYDPDSGDSLTLSVAPAGPFGLGQHPVTLLGTDTHAASTASAAFVTVADQTGPAIGAVEVERQLAPAPRHGMVLATVDYTAVDNCGEVTTRLVATSGSGEHSAPQVIDAHHVLLKIGESYSLAIVAIDAAGNESVETVTVNGRPHE
jgi:rhodanese-related sulfurtransferase